MDQFSPLVDREAVHSLEQKPMFYARDQIEVGGVARL